MDVRPFSNRARRQWRTRRRLRDRRRRISLPPVRRWRLESLARLLVPYHSDDTIDDGITITREVFHATAALARAHGAAALIVVPQFGQEAHSEEILRRRILDGSGVPYVL